MAEDDVDAMLERAFNKVEEAEKNGAGDTPMHDLIMAEAKKAGISTDKSGKSSSKRKDDGDGRKRSGSGDSDRDDKRRRSPSRDKNKSSSTRDRDRDVDRERKRRRSKSRSRSKERYRSSRRSRSRSKERYRSSRRSRSRSRDRRPSRDRSPYRGRSPQPPPRRLPGPERRDVMPFVARQSPPAGVKADMTPEERDDRTVFILQLHRNTRPRDLEEFFSSVGNVRDVRIITDSKTRRSKGIAYVEFWEREAVPLAMGLGGQKLLGAPLVIQMTQADRNRAANAASMGNAIGLGLLPNLTGSMKLCVSNLHPNITDDMLNAIFEPFGRVERCEISKDEKGQSMGYGYVKFRHADEGKRAFEQLNGFELAGKNIRLTIVEEDEDTPQQQQAARAQQRAEQEQSLESEDRTGGHNRLQLMAKLAQAGGMEVPQGTREAIEAQQAQASGSIPAIATQCFMLSNMFDPSSEAEVGWELDVRDDVIEECNNNGGVVHLYVDKASPQGNVYVKCPTVAAAHRSVVALHGRWFAGKVITANYVPVNSYNELFPEARQPNLPPLVPRSR